MPFWRWDAFFHYLGNRYILGGVFTTIWTSVAAMSIGLTLGLIVALMQMSDRWILNRPPRLYLLLWRGTPLLVQLIIIYTGLPQIGIRLSVLQSALIGLGLHQGAYLCEVIRGGIIAVGEGQYFAARALGMNYWTMMRVVILPQAARVIIPPLGNRVNDLLKTTSLLSVISMEELLRRSRMLMEERFAVLEIFTVCALYYLLMTTVWSRVQNRIEARLGRGYGGSISGATA